MYPKENMRENTKKPRFPYVNMRENSSKLKVTKVIIRENTLKPNVFLQVSLIEEITALFNSLMWKLIWFPARKIIRKYMDFQGF